MAYIAIGLVVGLGLASGLALGRVVRIRQAIYWHGIKWSSPVSVSVWSYWSSSNRKRTTCERTFSLQFPAAYSVCIPFVFIITHWPILRRKMNKQQNQQQIRHMGCQAFFTTNARHGKFCCKVAYKMPAQSPTQIEQFADANCNLQTTSDSQ